MLNDDELELIRDHYKKEHASAIQDALENDTVVKNIGYKSFFSRSMGRGRKRKVWKDIELFHYKDGWHTATKFEFDVVAQEVAPHMDDDAFLEYIRKWCGNNKNDVREVL